MAEPKRVLSVRNSGDLYVDGVATGVHLTKREVSILRAIFSHSRVATFQYLMSVLYAGRDEPEIKILAVFVCKLRKKLGEHRDAIRTIWARGFTRGEGYVLEAEPEGLVGVPVKSELIEELSYATGETASALIDRLLRAEHKRVWEAA